MSRSHKGTGAPEMDRRYRAMGSVQLQQVVRVFFFVCFLSGRPYSVSEFSFHLEDPGWFSCRDNEILLVLSG